MKITGEMTVAALLMRWPTLMDAFLRHGMSCPGCVMSRFDALDYVADVYRLGRRRWLHELRSAAARPGGDKKETRRRNRARIVRPGRQRPRSRPRRQEDEP